ncbi:MAG: hypothetical protein ABFR36_07725 [Acidobacteriota bacterium]
MRNREAEKIYRSVFKKDIPEIVLERFNKISERIEEGVPPGEIEKYHKITGNITDLAAAEYASRILKKNPLLIKKFQTMIYLGECLPENYDLFINEKKRVIKTLLIFAAVPFNSVYKFFKGFLALKVKSG